jgi:hypothetical protein
MRRWKNEGVQPSPKHAKALQKLAREYKAAVADQRSRARSESRRDAYEKTGSRAAVPDATVKVVPTLTRQRMRVVVPGEFDKRGKPKGRYVGSPYIRADVRKMSESEISDFLVSYFKKRQQFGLPAIMYALVTGYEYPGGDEEDEEEGGRQRWRTKISVLSTESGIRRWLAQQFRPENGQRPLEIYVLDSD